MSRRRPPPREHWLPGEQRLGRESRQIDHLGCRPAGRELCQGMLHQDPGLGCRGRTAGNPHGGQSLGRLAHAGKIPCPDRAGKPLAAPHPLDIVVPP